MKYYIKVTCAFKWARKLPRKTVTYESAKCVPCNTRKCTHNGFVSDLLKWALKCRFYVTGPRFVVGFVLFTDRGIKPLKSFIQLFKRKLLRAFFGVFSSHQFSKTLNQLTVLGVQVFGSAFDAATSESVISSNPDAILAASERLPWQFCNFTCEIIN